MNFDGEIKDGISTSEVEALENQSFALPASFAQQRLWMIDQLSPGTPVYNVPVYVRLCGSLNLTALERSLQEIVRRHEVLRATFVLQGGAVFQVISPASSLTLPLINLQNVKLQNVKGSERET